MLDATICLKSIASTRPQKLADETALAAAEEATAVADQATAEA